MWAGVTGAVSAEGRLRLMVRDNGGEAPARPDVSFREAGAEDAARYARDIGTDSPSTFRRRLSPWTRCFVVDDGSTFLHASWMTTARAWTSEIRGYISPPLGDAYVYESFTRPETRGRGIYPFALLSICAELERRQVPRAWVGVEADNAPSIRAITKAGFEDAFEITFHRRLGRVQIDDLRGPLAEQGRTMIRSARSSSF